MSKYTAGSGNSAPGNRRKSIFTPSINNTNLNESSAQAIELERLEQEITLTLQTIDKSFAKSHKIINDKLIPIVKKYHTSSKKIWQGVSFWKNFLETSANVELRGYEEAVQDQDEYSEQQHQIEQQQQQQQLDLQHPGDPNSNDTVHLNEQFSPVKATEGTNHDVLMESTNHTIQQRYNNNFSDEAQPSYPNSSSMFKSSTPNRLKENPIMPQIHKQNNLEFDTTDSILPAIPVSANLSNTNGTDVNQTTPTLQRSNTDIATDQQQQQQQPGTKNYILHNNLDTNYKVEISPRRKHPHQSAVVNQYTPKKPPQKKRKSIYAQKYDSSPFEIGTPKLQSDVQFSPVRQQRTQASPSRKSNQIQQDIQDENQTQRFPHTPRYGAGGQLLHTPGQVSRTANRYSNHGFDQQDNNNNNNNNKEVQSGLQFDDSEQTSQISPPVTLNFTTNQNLKKTPAREAAQNIVKDILNNVSGVNDSGLSGFEEFGGGVNNNNKFDDTDPQDSLFNEIEQQQNPEQQKQSISEFDDFLDQAHKEHQQKGNNPDWSDDN